MSEQATAASQAEQIEDLGAIAAAVPRPAFSVRKVASEIVPVVDTLRAITRRATTGIENVDPVKCRIEDRAALVQLHEQLSEIADQARMYAGLIEGSFKRAMIRERIRVLPLGRKGYEAKLLEPQATWLTKGDEMRRALLPLVDRGMLSRDELDEALAVISTVKPNHTKLNTLVRNRGALVEQAIEANRERTTSDPLAGRMSFPARRGEFIKPRAVEP